MADANVSGDAGRPDPAKATTPAEFVEAMRGLKRWTGFGLRRLEKRAAAGGHTLPRSTLTVALSRDTVPRVELVAAFAHACGCDEEETARWVAARRRVAAAQEPAPPSEAAPAQEPAPASKTVPTLTAPPSTRRRVRRLVPALLALAAAVTTITFLLGSGGGPGGSRQGAGDPDDPTHAPPGSSRTRTSGPSPEPTTVGAPIGGGGDAPTDGANQGGANQGGADPGVLAPVGLDPPNPTESPGAPPPGPPAPDGTVPPAPEQSDRATFPVEGEAPVHCPMPWVVNDRYGPIAQCTQVSGGQARIGFYSGVTGKFSPSSDWMKLADERWFDGTLVGNDDVAARARGYGVFDTAYGAGVFATQFRGGEGRWGTGNLVNGGFYPSAQGWQRTIS